MARLKYLGMNVIRKIQMTRQEKIRGGIAKVLHAEDNPFPFKPTWEEEIEKDYWYWYADKLIQYLDSQGVVLKVEKELPTGVICFLDDRYSKYEFQGVLEEHGYVAVESLEVKDG